MWYANEWMTSFNDKLWEVTMLVQSYQYKLNYLPELHIGGIQARESMTTFYYYFAFFVEAYWSLIRNSVNQQEFNFVCNIYIYLFKTNPLCSVFNN